MPITIDPLTRVIYVPRDYLVHTDGETHSGIHIYEMDVDAFRLDLKAWEASEEGMNMPDTHRHNTEVTLGGITYARFVEIINGYVVLFEAIDSPPDEHYMVRLIGANNNVAEVADLHGQVSVLTNNSAGLVVQGGADPNVVAGAVFTQPVEGTLNFRSAMRLAVAVLMGKVSGADTNSPTFRNTGDTKNRVVATTDDYGNRSSVTLDPSD